MEFTDNIFLLFIVGFYVIYLLITKLGASLQIQNHAIALFSLIFYGSWYPPAVFLILFHALLARVVGQACFDGNRKVLGLSVAVSLAVLFVFKYYNFFVDLIGYSEWVKNIILPVGISFYTFTAIGYYVDLYRKEVEPEKNYSNLVLFLAFWPHLAAGPVLRAKNIFHNIYHREIWNREDFALALALIVSGLFKKLVIADNIGAYVNHNVSNGFDAISGLAAMMTVIGFGAQIYADFSGYSDMAIGFALLLGFRLPANFNYPYISRTLTEFWRRWHISLSTWFRDYLYIPLGGNRKGIARGYVNVFLVFFLSGIWHGAGINFAVWGAIHGLFLIFERLNRGWYGQVWWPMRWLVTYIVANIAWAFFFLDHNQAMQILSAIFSVGDGWVGELTAPHYIAAIAMMMLLIVYDHGLRLYRVNDQGYPYLLDRWYVAPLLLVMIISALVFSGSPLPFIYFEF